METRARETENSGNKKEGTPIYFGAVVSKKLVSSARNINILLGIDLIIRLKVFLYEFMVRGVEDRLQFRPLSPGPTQPHPRFVFGGKILEISVGFFCP